MILNSMRARMTLQFSTVTAFVMVCACGSIILYANYDAESNAKNFLSAAAKRINTEISGNEHIEDFAALLEEERDLLGDGLVLTLVDPSGTIVAKSQKRVPNWPNPNSRFWRIQTVPFGLNRVVIGLPWDKTQNILDHQSIVFTTFGLAVIVLTALGAWILVGRTLSPLSRLSIQAQTAAADKLRISLSPPSQDSEIVELVATLNSLLSRLAQTTEAKARFYSAASHELRNPLQALSGHLELSASKPRTFEEKSETIREASIQTQRLVTLVRDLLILNRLEFQEASSQKEIVEISDICQHVIRHYENIIANRNLLLHMELENTEITTVHSHADMFIGNLVENAVKYTPENGVVWINLQSSQFTISNTISENIYLDTVQLFEAFYRPDESRNSETGGNGLGLAICRAIASANNWGISLEQHENKIVCMVKFVK